MNMDIYLYIININMDYFRNVEPEVSRFEYDNSYRYIKYATNPMNHLTNDLTNDKLNNISSDNISSDNNNKNKYLYFISIYYINGLSIDTVRVSYSLLASLKKEFPNKFVYKYKSCCWVKRYLCGEKGDV